MFYMLRRLLSFSQYSPLLAENIKSSNISFVCAGFNIRFVFHAKLSVSCCSSAHLICRWYCSVDYLFDFTDKPHKWTFWAHPTLERNLLCIAAIAGAVLCIITILDYKFAANTAAAHEVNMNIIGKDLMNYSDNGYILPFEVISILLLAAMIASIVIAKKIKIDYKNSMIWI